MVQRKVSNKLSIQPIQIQNTHLTPNPSSLQNYHVKIKAADLKSKRMKKTRSIKRPDMDFNVGSPLKTRQVFRPPGEAPTKTPTPNKPVSGNKTWAYGSPNYMKGTSSSEARKEKPSVGKSSSFKKVRTLTTKSPSFKHTRTGAHNKNKLVVCQNLESQRATCSSTLKDSKFPSYLKLAPAATEAQGTSVIKVCPYNYCSLNGHRHAVAPPLKPFLSSRRRMLKTLKNVKPGAFNPCKPNQAEDEKDDFFVEIHIPRHDSEANLSEMNFSCEEKIDEEYPSTPVQNEAACFDAIDQGMDSDSSVSVDQVFGEISDMEWEEGENTEMQDELPLDNVNGDDQREGGFELYKFLAEKLLPYIHDEIIECLLFSDADTISDTDSSLTEDEFEEQIVDNESICSTQLKQDFTEEENGDLDEDLYICKQTKDDVVMVVNVSTETEKQNQENVAVQEQISMPDNASQAQVQVTEEASLTISAESQQPEQQYETEAKKAITIIANQEQNSKVNLDSFDDHAVQVTTAETEHGNLTEDEAATPAIRNECQKVRKAISAQGIASTDDLFNSCNKLKRSVRCKKSDQGSDDDREFNPRPPNFLPVEPEQEAEKVDLRHQDMEERRTAQEWMIDHALQKTVTQLAVARKRKVALLVEAFESVLPIPKYEPQMPTDSSSFYKARHIQACR